MNRFKLAIIAIPILFAHALSPCALAQAHLFDGKPIFAEGVELGYYIWREDDKWRIRWTTLGQMRRFSGSVVAEGGKLKSLDRVDVETERRVLYPGRAPRVWVGPRGRTHVRGGRAPVVVERKQDKIEKDGDYRIVFLTKTDDVDGFDFKVDDKVTSLRFVLEIDGRLMPRHVEVGRENRKAPSLPLIVRLN